MDLYGGTSSECAMKLFRKFEHFDVSVLHSVKAGCCELPVDESVRVQFGRFTRGGLPRFSSRW